MGKPNNARCPRCRAKLRKHCGPAVYYTCQHAPKIGGIVRINCPLWRAGK